VTAHQAFVIGTQYELREASLELDPSGATFQHPSGIRTGIGQTPNGTPACLAESDQTDQEILRLLGRNRDGTLSEAEAVRLGEFSSEVRRHHRAAAEDTVGVLRWMTGRDGFALGAGHWARWSTGDREWLPLPIRDAPTAEVRWGSFPFTRDLHLTAAGVVNAGGREPIGHELWQEAKGLLDVNLRSTLVLGVSALEAGVKEHLSKQGHPAPIGPGSPSVMRLLHQRVPVLNRKRWLELPDWLDDRLMRAVSARNAAVHSGVAAPPREELRVFLRGVRDVLYLMDYQAGQEWAMGFVTFPHGDLDLVGPKPEIRIVAPVM